MGVVERAEAGRVDIARRGIDHSRSQLGRAEPPARDEDVMIRHIIDHQWVAI